MGKRLFFPGAQLSKDQLAIIAEEAKALRKEASVQGNQHWRDFEVFQETQKLEGRPIIERLEMYAAAQRNAGLKASSIATSLRKLFQHSGWPIERKVHVERLAKAVERKYKDSVDQAPYYTGEDLLEVIKHVTDEDGMCARIACELMLFCPLRFADLLHLDESRMLLEGKYLHIQVWQTKTIRDARNRLRIKVPVSCLAPRTKKELTRRLSRKPCVAGKIAPKSKPLLAGLTLDRFNKVLKEAGSRAFPTREPPTSYSIRYFYIRKVVRKHTRNGKTDWQGAAEETLHRGVKALKSAYTLALPRAGQA